MERIYIAIDLKSFYASVECVERNLDALNTNLVVADSTRTEKTICLAVSPSLKSYGIPGRARLFEVVQKVEQVNNDRRYKAPGACGRLYCRAAADGEIHEGQRADIRDISEVCCAGGYFRVLGGRGVY